MKGFLVLAVCLTLLLVVDGKGPGKRRKAVPVIRKENFVTYNEPKETLSSGVKSEVPSETKETPEDEEEQDRLLQRVLKNPCYKIRCGAGKVCQVDDNGDGLCVCIPECQTEVDPRRKVCSNLNSTWDSDCALHQMRCWCKTGDDKCLDQQLAHMHIDYYGECRQLNECTNEMMEDFPRRMRHWLFYVMQELAERDELSEHYLKLEAEAVSNVTKRWANAAIWKWCDLKKSKSSAVSRHDLFPLRAPILSMEQCIAPFLDGCDYDDDHSITLTEWAKCLEIEQEEIENKCEEFSKDDDLEDIDDDFVA